MWIRAEQLMTCMFSDYGLALAQAHQNVTLQIPVIQRHSKSVSFGAEKHHII